MEIRNVNSATNINFIHTSILYPVWYCFMQYLLADVANNYVGTQQLLSTISYSDWSFDPMFTHLELPHELVACINNCVIMHGAVTWPCGKSMYIMYNLHVTHGCKLLVKYCLQGHPSQRGFPTIFLAVEIIMIDSKVTNLQLPVLTDKNVSSSETAMNYLLLCQVFLYIYQQNLAPSINFGENLEFSIISPQNLRI